MVLESGDEPHAVLLEKIVAALAAHGICEPMSEQIKVGLGDRAYDIHVGGGLLARAGLLLNLWQGRCAGGDRQSCGGGSPPALLEALRQAGIDARAIVMPPGEVSKSFAGLERLSGALLEMGVDRRA